jgi:hypothetical protein
VTQGIPVAARGRDTRPRPARLRIDTARWLGALDALLPYVIAVIAVAVARHAFASPRSGTIAAIIATALLALGTLLPFFRSMPAAHLSWPVALVLCAIILPLLALHVQVESSALAAPAAIHLLPLAFTWTGLVIGVSLTIGIVYATAAAHPGWAGLTICPLVLLLGAVPVLSANPSRAAVLTAALYSFAGAEIIAGVGWLIPEQRRWLIIPVVLALGAAIEGHAFASTAHHLPGRALLLVDAAIAVASGLVALAAPLVCGWLTGPKGAGRNE